MADTGPQGGRHVVRQRRAATLAALVARREAANLGRADVARAAEGLGVCERTVWRWLTKARTSANRAKFELTKDDLLQLASWHGNVAALHRERGGQPSLRTLYRAVENALTRGQLAGLTGGERARRDFDTYMARAPRHRNECWEADHCELAIEVLAPDGQIIKPWLTSFLDRFSRGLCGWAISGYPSQESVLAALRTAILTDPPCGPIGGIPASIRWDRGKEFLAKTIRTVTLSLAIDAKALPAYSPHLKGAIERFHDTIETRLLSELPGFVHLPTGKSGRRCTDPADLLPLGQFVNLFVDFARGYNERDIHASLDGETPLGRWLGDQTPIQRIEAEHLHHLLLARESRIVGKKGIRLLGSYYNCADLVGLVGETVEVRYMSHHHARVEVFLNDRHIGTAIQLDAMDDDDVKRLIARRRADERWLAQHQLAAARQRRRRFAPLTASVPGDASKPAVPVRVLTPSRSLRMNREIPEGMVRPLTDEEVEELREKG